MSWLSAQANHIQTIFNLTDITVGLQQYDNRSDVRVDRAPGSGAVTRSSIKDWCSLLSCLMFSTKKIDITSRHVSLLHMWKRSLAEFSHLRVVQRELATPKRGHYTPSAAFLHKGG